MVNRIGGLTYGDLGLWVAFTAIPPTIGFVFSYVDNSEYSPLFWFIPSLIIPFWLQWIVLRKYINYAYAWLVLGPLGFFIGAIVPPLALPYTSYSAHYTLSDTFLPLSVGLCTGVAQYFLLRLSVPKAYWWILASTLGWFAALTVISVATFIPEFITGLAFGLIYGCVTGGMLASLTNSTYRGL